MDPVERIKTLALEEKILIGLIAIFAIVSISFSLSFHALPGPVYGGDVYYHFGKINQLAEGGSLFESSHFKGEYEHYGWLSNALTASLTYLGLSPLKATITFAWIIQILGAIVIYLLMSRLTSKTVGLFFAAIVLATPLVNLPTVFSTYVLIPLGILAAFTFTNPYGKGLVYAACGIAHPISFAAINLLYPSVALYRIVRRTSTITDQAIHLAKTYAVGIPIALLYWGPLIVRYGGNNLNPWQEYVRSDPIILQTIRGVFFSTNTPIAFALSMLAIAGFILAIKNRRLILIPVGIMLFGLVHPYLTQPLVGTSLGWFGFAQMRWITTVLLAGLALGALLKMTPERLHTIALILLLSVVAIQAQANYSRFTEDRWTQMAFDPRYSINLENPLIDHIKETTSTDDVFLTLHPESSFALNGVTGRKVVHLRITHASTFVDVNQRILDAALILYSNDSETVNRLLQRYETSHLYIDAYGLQSWMNCDAFFEQGGHPETSYACLRIDYDPEYERILEAHGLEYERLTARKNVASENAPLFDQIAIRPREGIVFNRFEVERQLTDQDQVIAQLVRIT
jgi:hypothetical protein